MIAPNRPLVWSVSVTVTLLSLGAVLVMWDQLRHEQARADRAELRAQAAILRVREIHADADDLLARARREELRQRIATKQAEEAAAKIQAAEMRGRGVDPKGKR